METLAIRFSPIRGGSDASCFDRSYCGWLRIPCNAPRNEAMVETITFVGIYRGIIRNQGFLGGAGFRSSTVGVIKVRKWNRLFSFNPLGGDFDHGKITRPVRFDAIRGEKLRLPFGDQVLVGLSAIRSNLGFFSVFSWLSGSFRETTQV